MDRWIRLVVRWKLVFGVVVPLSFVAIAFLSGTPSLAVEAALLVGVALGVVYLYARHVDIES